MNYYIIVFAATVAVGNCQLLSCTWVSTLNCLTYPASTTECGTDGKDYANRCYFAKAQCLNKDLHLYAETSCADANYVPSGMTTVAPAVTTLSVITGAVTATSAAMGPVTTRAPVFLGHNVVLDFFCLQLSHEQCPTDTEKVCASDMKTYANFCEFDKARCSHRTLSVAHFGAC